MQTRIRVLGAFLIACFAVLFVQLNNLQVRQANALAHAPGNPIGKISAVTKPRGPLLSSDGVMLAYSKPSNDAYKYLRVYPQGALFEQLTGYDSLIYGTSGAESTYNSYLVAHSSPVRTLEDLLSSHLVTDTVVTTVNYKLQLAAVSALGSYRGSVVAIDPKTGAILAMYSSPSFDPNLLASHSAKTQRLGWLSGNSGSQPLLPRTYAQNYPPGSTFKIVTSAAVLDHKPSLATKVIPTETSIPLPQSNLRLRNYAGEACGGAMLELFTVSCDTGYATLGLALGGPTLAGEANRFGFNRNPPLDLPPPPEVVATFPTAASFAQNQPGVAYSSIGQQNVRASALQMAMVAGAIANGGIMMTPHVMEQIRDANGHVVKKYKPRPWLRATSAATAAQITSMMVNVVHAGTAAGIGFAPSDHAAAKTGTAQNGPGQCCTNWLVTFAPSSDPSIAVAAVVPFQTGLGSAPQGATIAGPIAMKVLEAALRLHL